MEKHVMLLRGINVGGHKKVPMKELKKVLEIEGFHRVKTLLNSGNVVFEAEQEKANGIEQLLGRSFGFPIHVIMLPFGSIADMVESEPFRDIEVTSKTRRFVTFTGGRQAKSIKIPYQTEDGTFRIIGQSGNAVFSVLDLENTGTVEAMSILEKEFGKEITTRNYNTIEKIAKL